MNSDLNELTAQDAMQLVKNSVNDETVQDMIDNILTHVFDKAKQGYLSFDYEFKSSQPRMQQVVSKHLRELGYNLGPASMNYLGSGPYINISWADDSD